MIASVTRRRSKLEARRFTLGMVALVAALGGLAACSEQGVLEPAPATTSVRTPASLGHASVVVTPDYSSFDTRTDFTGAGVVDQLNTFDEFTGGLVYEQSTPWTTQGVSYTSGHNIVLGPGVGLGVTSNSISADYGAPVMGQLASDDAFTLFGADVTIYGSKVPVGLVISTNLGSYTLANLDVPLATSGRRFVGVVLSRAGEYLTGFRFTPAAGAAAVLLDNVAVGHVAVRNSDPDVVAGEPYVGLEGSVVAFGMSGSDIDGDALTYSWDLGDGTLGTGATPPASHTYADNGSYNIMLAVADGRGGVDTARTTATIANVAPVLASFSVPNTTAELTATGVTVPVASTFTDLGSADTHTGTLACGVGDVTAAQVDVDATSETVGGTCAFTSAGVYSIRLTVRDDDGASDTELAAGYVVVYDPSGGPVTGGGWIASPASAYAAAPTTGGKLTFALLVRYQAGATVPSGSADFKLNVAKLEFRSTAFDWMTVAGTTVRIQGRGTLNGAGDYAFGVVAQDGVVTDAIRIRIWHRVTGEIVYDNQPGQPMESDPTALGGGTLEVHHQ